MENNELERFTLYKVRKGSNSKKLGPFLIYAGVVELGYTVVLETIAFGIESSSLSFSTKLRC